MLKKVAIAMPLFIVIFVAVAVGSYKYYKNAEYKEKLNSAMARDAAYAETILKIESDSSNITYAELFSLCDKSIEGRQGHRQFNRRPVEQTSYTGRHHAIRGAVDC